MQDVAEKEYLHRTVKLSFPGSGDCNTDKLLLIYVLLWLCVWQHKTVAGTLQCTAKLPSLFFITAQPLIQSPRLREDWLNSRLLNAWDPHRHVNESIVMPIFVILGLDPAPLRQIQAWWFNFMKDYRSVPQTLTRMYILYIMSSADTVRWL